MGGASSWASDNQAMVVMSTGAREAGGVEKSLPTIEIPRHAAARRLGMTIVGWRRAAFLDDRRD
jgi:hypothetical protein